MTDTKKDVEMEDVEKKKNQELLQELLEPPTTYSELKNVLSLLEKTAATKETRLLSRVLRKTTELRKKITKENLNQAIKTYYPPNDSIRNDLLNHLASLPTPMEEETSAELKPSTPPTSTTTTAPPPPPTSIVLEVDIYLHLFVVMHLIDKKNYEEAITCSTSLVNRLNSFTRPTLSPLTAKAFFYYSRSYELTHRLSEIRGNLLSAYRTAVLRHDIESQATILNLLLRNYLEYNLFEQADKLVSKASFPEAATASLQYARYLYYQGKIKSAQLEYSDAFQHLQQAIRKAPQASARGFRETVYKLLCIVQLLTGTIPERSIFMEPGLKRPLKPYYQLTQAVRIGDVAAFHKVVDTYRDTFISHKTFTLIQRLRQNVIKTALRNINLSYSRISLVDICSKLKLESIADTEFIVAKAIHDGVIEGTIVREGPYLQSKEVVDVYSTEDPQEAFHHRITFCLKIHNEAVKAMVFPDHLGKEQVDEESRPLTEAEIADSLEKEDGTDDESF